MRTQIGIHVDRDDLDAAIAMAEKIDCYQRVEAGKTGSGKGKQESKTQMKNDQRQGGPQLNMIQGGDSSARRN